MLARSGLVGKNSSRPHLGPFEAIFSMGRTNAKNIRFSPIFLGGPMGPIHPVWGHLVMFVWAGSWNLRVRVAVADATAAVEKMG